MQGVVVEAGTVHLVPEAQEAVALVVAQVPVQARRDLQILAVVAVVAVLTMAMAQQVAQV